MSENEKWQPSIEDRIEAKFGKEALEEAARISTNIFKQIKIAMLDIGLEAGPSDQQQEKARKLLEMWHDFSNGLFTRTSSQNLRSPEVVTTAIRGAAALMSVEPERERDESAKAMVDALKNRYSI